MKLFIYFAFLFLIGCSCSDEKPNFNKVEVLQMMLDGDPGLEIMVPKSMAEPLVVCADYLPPCKVGYKVKINGMEVVGLYYESQKNAYKSAKSMRGYHVRNWAFDQVKGEPILERFFKKPLNAHPVE
ncbi:MAG: hypothetical protein CME64_01920 [Halobacteriovoraceae bacterium]|nr:hypothetical protein [Halobacteriovoraceae bacterium]